MVIRGLWILARKLTRLLELWHTRGFSAVVATARERLWPVQPKSITAWHETYRPTPALLQRFRKTAWPSNAPTISVIVPIFDTHAEWLRTALDSVLNQTYAKWQLLCVNDASTQPHVAGILADYRQRETRCQVLHLPVNGGVSAACNAALAVATGEIVCVLDHDDALEPHALHRLAQVMLSDNPDLVSSDEALATEDFGTILAVRVRPAFSHDYYMCHPYFVHLVAFRTTALRSIGGWNPALTVSQDVDVVLRVLERAERITHIPDVLYRWRTHGGSLGHQQQSTVAATTCRLLRQHVQRLGFSAEVLPHPTRFNVYRVAFAAPEASRVAIIILTKNRADLLRACIASLERTTDRHRADIVIVDHDSDDREAQRLLAELRLRHRVVTVSGPFHFPKFNNQAVADIRGPYSHYLFLNNDTVAPQLGWLDSMLGLCCRADVGAVGAMLIYPDNTIQHGGIGLGLLGGADHAYRGRVYGKNSFEREPGENAELLCTRDVTAATAACLLVRAEVFHAVGGFDERFVVGFNDVDLGIRIRQAGHKVLLDANVVLIHHESQTRGSDDRHPHDTARFHKKYQAIIDARDPHLSPLHDPSPAQQMLIPGLTCPEFVTPRTVTLASRT